MPKNVILYGPPGTGKTYHSIDKAIEILDKQYYAQNKHERDKLKKRFDDYVEAGRINFVTFHQSFAYEDFVEGIRAGTTNDGQLRYEVEDGIFKQLCSRAHRATGQGRELGVNDSPRIWKISIDGTGPSATRDYCLEHGQARIGWGQVGDLQSLDEASSEAFKLLGRNDQSTLRAFSYDIRKGDILLCIRSRTEIQALGVVESDYTFDEHPPEPVQPDFNHIRTVNWLVKDVAIPLQSLNGNIGFTQKTVYELDRFTWNDLLAFLKQQNVALISGSNNNERPEFVLIIDEINRGNISRIFGELITLIEPSKRQGCDEALQVTLPYSKDPFSVPSNIHIIGTMNTADRSLTGLDIALRRRFVFEEVPPHPDLLAAIEVEGVDIRGLLEVLNARIEVLLDRDHCLGHSYFLPLASDNSLTRLARVFEQEVIPLLREYFFDDMERIRWVLNDHRKPAEFQFLSKQNGDLRDLLGDEPGMPTESRTLQLNATAFGRIESYKGIIAPQAMSKQAAS